MSKLRVLVVDDASFIREFIKKGLGEKFPGFTISEAINGLEAQKLLREEGFDLILCDWEMPEMSGEELCRWMRGEEALKRLPFIMVTSRGEREHVVRAVQAGVSNYIVKPFTIEALVAKMAQTLKGRPPAAKAASPPKPAASPTPKPAAGPDGSAAVLTQGRAIPKPRQVSGGGDTLSILTGGRGREQGRAKGEAPRPVVHLRFNGDTVKSVLKNITLTGVEAIVRREDPLPGLLEPMVVDIEATRANETMRMNAFVHRIQAVQPSLQATQFQLHIRFADDDPVKSENLSKFIHSLR